MRQQRTKPFAVWVTSLPLNALSPHVAPAATCAIASIIGADRKHHALPPSHACFQFFELSLYNVPYYAAATATAPTTHSRPDPPPLNNICSGTIPGGKPPRAASVRLFSRQKNNADGSGRTELQGISEEQPQCDVIRYFRLNSWRRL